MRPDDDWTEALVDAMSKQITDLHDAISKVEAAGIARMDALNRQAADDRHLSDTEIARQIAALRGEVELTVLRATAEANAACAALIETLRAKLDGVKDGPPGPAGAPGAPGEPGQRGEPGLDRIELMPMASRAGMEVARGFQVYHRGGTFVACRATMGDPTEDPGGYLPVTKGLDHVRIETDPDDDRNISLILTLSDCAVVRRDMTVSALRLRDVYEAGTVYVKNDVVKHSRGLWVALGRTVHAPTECNDWTLLTKPPRDGAKGDKGDPGPPGPLGPVIRSITRADGVEVHEYADGTQIPTDIDDSQVPKMMRGTQAEFEALLPLPLNVIFTTTDTLKQYSHGGSLMLSLTRYGGKIE